MLTCVYGGLVFFAFCAGVCGVSTFLMIARKGNRTPFKLQDEMSDRICAQQRQRRHASSSTNTMPSAPQHQSASPMSSAAAYPRVRAKLAHGVPSFTSRAALNFTSCASPGFIFFKSLRLKHYLSAVCVTIALSVHLISERIRFYGTRCSRNA